MRYFFIISGLCSALFLFASCDKIISDKGSSGKETVPGVNAKGNIIFSDPIIKTKLVAAYDKNSDGEISLSEAAAVKTITTSVFKGGNTSQFTSFDEFRFFTGLSTISYNLFDGWSNLTSIILPDSITSIEGCAFQ